MNAREELSEYYWILASELTFVHVCVRFHGGSFRLEELCLSKLIEQISLNTVGDVFKILTYVSLFVDTQISYLFLGILQYGWDKITTNWSLMTTTQG